MPSKRDKSLDSNLGFFLIFRAPFTVSWHHEAFAHQLVEKKYDGTVMAPQIGPSLQVGLLASATLQSWGTTSVIAASKFCKGPYCIPSGILCTYTCCR